MRISAFLGVLDEVEILVHALAHLRAIGVDLVIAHDAGSTDGSLDILLAEQARGTLHLLPGHGSDDPWFREPIRIAQRLGADWLLFLDADEFWLPTSGSLRDIPALADADIVQVERRNVPYGPDGPYMPLPADIDAYERTYLVGDGAQRPDELQADPLGTWVRAWMEPKMMVRPELVTRAHEGHHDVDVTAWTSPRRLITKDIVIAHVPITTWERFRRRVDNIRTTIAEHPRYFERHAWHWVRFAELDAAGRLRHEYDRGAIDRWAADRMLADGQLTTAAAFLGSGHERDAA